jgi:hypothetical protein
MGASHFQEASMLLRTQALALASLTTALLTLASVEMSAQTVEKAKTTRNCVADTTKPDAPATCYNSFTEAIAAATNGKIKDAPIDSRVAMNDKALLAKLNPTGDKKIPKDKNALEVTGIVAIIFYDDGFGTPSLIWTGPACSDTLDDIDSSVRYVGDDWNDDFESIQMFNNCWVKLFEHIDFGGSSLGWTNTLSDFGVLNDEVSSMQFS